MKKSELKQLILEVIKEEGIPSALAPQQAPPTSFEEGLKKYELSDPPIKKNTIRMLDFIILDERKPRWL